MKQNITAFDLESAFKALDEIDIPAVKGGVKANRLNLHENFSRRRLKTDALIEDYYDLASKDELEAAQALREDDIAKAKLAKIEKIVDLDAESPEDIQPSYVGKFIMQCPQCMTLFYKAEEDIVPSEDDPHTVNVGEECQHCGYKDGYMLIGKVGEATPEEVESEEEVTEEEIPEDLPEEESEENVESEEKTEGPESEGEPTEDEMPDLEELPELEAEDEEEKSTNESLMEALGEESGEYEDYEQSFIDDACWEIYKTGEFNTFRDDHGAAVQVEKIIARYPEWCAHHEAVKGLSYRTKEIGKYAKGAGKKLEIVRDEDRNFGIKAVEATDEGLLPDLNINLDAHDFGGQNNNVSVLGGGIAESCEDGKCDESLLGADVNINANLSNFGGNGNDVGVLSGALKNEALTEANEFAISDSEMDALMNSDEMNTPISDAEVDSIIRAEESLKNPEDLLADVEDIDEESVAECLTEALTDIYENVNNFVMTSAEVADQKFIVEGVINFKSNKEQDVKFVFDKVNKISEELVFNGGCTDINHTNNFEVKCHIAENKLIANTANYKFLIEGKLIEGIGKVKLNG